MSARRVSTQMEVLVAEESLTPTSTHELVVDAMKLGSPSLRRVGEERLADSPDVEAMVAVAIGHGDL